MAGKTTKKTIPKRSAPTASHLASARSSSRSTKDASVKKSSVRTVTGKTERSERGIREEGRSVAASRSSLSTALPNMKVKRSTVLIGLAVVLIIALLYVFRGLFVVASVNGQPISRLSVIHELEQAYGKQQLNTDISKTLIMQQASKQHITVSQKDVDTDVKNVEHQLAAQGQKLDEVLAQQGMTRSQWLDGEKVRIILQKMFANDTKVSDKDINDYIAQNKSSLPDDAATNKQVRSSIKDRLTQQKLSTKIQSWLQAQQKSAKINYIVNY